MAKVLVVDDEKLIVKGIRFSLEQDAMEVDCAYDGEEAVNKAKETEYDVITLILLFHFLPPNHPMSFPASHFSLPQLSL